MMLDPTDVQYATLLDRPSLHWLGYTSDASPSRETPDWLTPELLTSLYQLCNTVPVRKFRAILRLALKYPLQLSTPLIPRTAALKTMVR